MAQTPTRLETDWKVREAPGGGWIVETAGIVAATCQERIYAVLIARLLSGKSCACDHGTTVTR